VIFAAADSMMNSLQVQLPVIWCHISGGIVCIHASFIKQCNLLSAKGQWCCVAEKVLSGLWRWKWVPCLSFAWVSLTFLV